MIYGELEWFPHEIKAKTRMIKVWSKILNDETVKYHIKSIKYCYSYTTVIYIYVNGLCI